jgi:acetyltransferase
MLETLIKPKSIAVIGASRTPGKVGYSILANLISSGFEGKIIPVNPQAEDILGLKCYKTPKDAGIPIDLSIIVVPSKLVKPAIEESVLAGAKSVCVITAGFKEIGPEGDSGKGNSRLLQSASGKTFRA